VVAIILQAISASS